MYIIPGPSSQVLAGSVARAMQCRLADTEFFHFPDGEQYLRVPDDVGDHVAIIQSTPTDSDYIALLQLIDACDAADRIDVVIPYFGYARQDHRFKHGEAVSARALARAITADRVFTINVHNQSVLQYFDADATDLDAAPAIGAHLASMKRDESDSLCIIAPDEGAIDLARSAADYLGVDFDYVEKTRLSGDDVTIKTKKLNVAGKDVVILDDIISTGGTIVKTALLLRENGADRVFAACIHPVLARNAATHLFSAGIEGIMAADTLDRSVSVISVAQLIADAI
ncbi:MAG TPA: ribose-phosphate diphosphokinase [Methanosarcinales archaeon]|nr:ribose-phosphate diphosphokinase [Methanosarcinales archaeon]